MLNTVIGIKFRGYPCTSVNEITCRFFDSLVISVLRPLFFFVSSHFSVKKKLNSITCITNLTRETFTEVTLPFPEP